MTFSVSLYCLLSKEELKNNRLRRRIYELLSKASASGPSHSSPGQRELHFVFFRKPDRFLGSGDGSGHVTGVHFEKTVLKRTFLFIDVSGGSVFMYISLCF